MRANPHATAGAAALASLVAACCRAGELVSAMRYYRELQVGARSPLIHAAGPALRSVKIEKNGNSPVRASSPRSLAFVASASPRRAKGV